MVVRTRRLRRDPVTESCAGLPGVLGLLGFYTVCQSTGVFSQSCNTKDTLAWRENKPSVKLLQDTPLKSHAKLEPQECPHPAGELRVPSSESRMPISVSPCQKNPEFFSLYIARLGYFEHLKVNPEETQCSLGKVWVVHVAWDLM